MRHLDLFSGIGGFALAAERVWPNVEHIFVENDPFCQAILRKHWPTSKIYGDIKTFDARELGPVDLITGGFPCQPFSHAGHRKGTEDDRDLWPEMARVIEESKPTWVVGENVARFAYVALKRTLVDLETLQYEARSFIVPACAVGAPHERDRVWIIANANDRREPHKTISTGRNISRRLRGYAPDSGSERRARSGAKPSPQGKRGAEVKRGDFWRRPWPTVAAELCRVGNGIPRELDKGKRIKALGNAIVPQLAQEFFEAINQVGI